MNDFMNEFVIIKNRRSDPFQWNLDRYANLVEEIEGGYGMCIYEYTNDLYCRNVIQEKLDAGFVPDDAAAERLRQLDERLRALLIPTTGSIHGNYPTQYFWFYGVPRNAEEVLEDARSVGAVT